MKFLTYNGLIYFWKKIKQEIDNLKSSVSNGKKLVANAITDKGVTTAEDATFATMAENISKISSGGANTSDATASASHILSGKTAYIATGKVEGTMPSYINGTYDTTSSNILSNAVAFKLPANGYYENSYVKMSNNVLAQHIGVTADKIVTGNTILGIDGIASSGGGIEYTTGTNYVMQTIDEINNYAISQPKLRYRDDINGTLMTASTSTQLIKIETGRPMTKAGESCIVKILYKMADGTQVTLFASMAMGLYGCYGSTICGYTNGKFYSYFGQFGGASDNTWKNIFDGRTIIVPYPFEQSRILELNWYVYD